MRFAYIDSNGNEVPIPSVDALALRIELGAITESTQLYDAQADEWGPAHTHEIFHTLSRDTQEEGGFVAPPPVAPPPVAPPPGGPDPRSGEPAEPELPEEEVVEETPPEDESFGLTLAEPEPSEAESLTEPGPADEEGGDDLPYLDLEEDTEPMEPTPDAGDAVSEEGGGFDFDGMEGGLELEEALEGPDEEPMDLAPGVEGGTTDLGGGMELESSMEFDSGGFEGGGAGPLDLEKPMSEFSPDEPPAWMEEDEAAVGDSVLDFSSAGAATPEGEPEVPLRERRTPRNRPSPPKLRRQRNLALPIVVVVLLLAVGIGGYVAWPIVSDRLIGSGEAETGEVYLPPLSPELMPTMRAAAEDALGAVFERERSEWARSSRVQEPPSAWLAGVYLANATDFGSVEEFWSGVSDFLAQVRGIDLETFDSALRAELQSRGVSGADAEAIRARADSGFVAAAPERAQVFQSFDQLIDAALQLHRFLVANESAIEYAPAAVVTTDPVLEVNPATPEIRAAMEELLDAVTRALGALDYRDRVTSEGLRTLLRTRIQEQGVE